MGHMYDCTSLSRIKTNAVFLHCYRSMWCINWASKPPPCPVLVRMPSVPFTLAPILFGNPKAHSSSCGKRKCSSFYPHVGQSSESGGNYRHLVVKDFRPAIKSFLLETNGWSVWTGMACWNRVVLVFQGQGQSQQHHYTFSVRSKPSSTLLLSLIFIEIPSN